jgi:hypothetical protein
MNAHQTLDKVKDGLNLGFMEITKALFETGDLVDKSDKHWLQHKSIAILEKHPEGMTSYKIARMLSVNPDVVRVSLSRNKRAYIHSWFIGGSGKPAALYKSVLEGVEAPENAKVTTVIQDRDERLKQLGHKPQNLTVWQPVGNHIN